MPFSAGDSRLRVVLRVLGVASAFGLGAVAACLIAFSSSTKAIQLGVIAGLWSALLGAVTIYGIRRQHAPAPTAEDVPTGAPELRASRVPESQQDAAAPRNDEQQLQDIVRRELAKIQQSLSEQLALVSAEVIALRGEFVEKVAGQVLLGREATPMVVSTVSPARAPAPGAAAPVSPAAAPAVAHTGSSTDPDPAPGG